MTDHPNKHCICHPPAELRAKWLTEDSRLHYCNTGDYAIDQAAEWGWQQRDASVPGELQEARDEELDACCEHIKKWFAAPEYRVAELRAARRPKPKSLAEEALQEINAAECSMDSANLGYDFTAVRRALERLQELEVQGND